jgi:hypothetical protein
VPCVGGQVCSVLIRDLAAYADGAVNSPESAVPELCAALFRLDEAIIRRLRASLQKDRRCCDALRNLLFEKEPTPERFSRFLDEGDRWIANVQSAEGYRPSHKDGGCPSASLMRIVLKSTPDELTRRAAAVSTALILPSQSPYSVPEPLAAVMFRPTEADKDWGRRVARNLLLTTYAGAQFVTAAAHSDAYPRFPLLLLRSQSHELRRTLTLFCQILDTVE